MPARTPGAGPEPLPTAPEQARIDEIDGYVAAGADGVGSLLAMLIDASWVVRRHVVDALATLGDDAVGPLVEMLAVERDSETRIAAMVDALVRSRGDVVPAISALAGADDPAVVADVAQILGRRRARHATALLDGLARHQDDNVAVAAIEALGRIGGRAAVDTLVAIAREQNFFRTFPALDILGRSGDPRAVEPLTELLAVPHFAMEAVRALGRTGDHAAAAPMVARLQRSNDAMVRVTCVALCDLKRRHERRFGNSESVERAVRAAAPRGAVRAVASAMSNAGHEERRDMAQVLGMLAHAAAIPHLAGLLDDEPEVAAAAAHALAHISSAGAEHVLAAVRGADSEHRKVLLEVLRAQRRSSAAVVECLEDPDPIVRAAACEALTRSGDKAVVDALFERLDDPDLRVVQTAVAAIQSLGSERTEALALAAAASDSRSRRRAALRILGYFGYDAAVDAFIEALESSDPRLQDAALQGLPLIDDPRARQALLDAAAAPSQRMRAGAMRALGASEPVQAVVDALVAGLDDEDAWVRYYAVQGLGRLHVRDAVERVAARLADPAGQVRVGAVEALAQLGGDTARRHLVATLESGEADARRAALVGLGLTGHPDDLATLLSFVGAEDLATRLVALSSLERYGGQPVLDAMRDAAREPVASLRNAALGFLAADGSYAASRTLIELLDELQRQPRSETDDVLQATADALATWSPARIEALVDAALEADDELAPMLTSALVRMQRVESRRALLHILNEAGPPGRKAAATALAVLREPEIIEALSERMNIDDDPEVRRVCAALLAR